MKMPRKRLRNVVHVHHISYEPEITVKIYAGEHWAITQLNRRSKNLSKGFIACLQAYIDTHKHLAVDLDDNDGEDTI